jgi:hypothetical protein
VSPKYSEHAPILRTSAIVFTLILTTLSLFYVGRQTKMLTNSSKAQTWQGLMQPGNEILKIFVEHPELRPYFYEGKVIKRDDEEYSQVMTVSEMFLDFIDSFHDDYVYDLPGMDANGETRHFWEQYFKDLFASSPALRDFLSEKQKWYPKSSFLRYLK